MTKATAIKTIKHSAAAAGHELARAGLPHAAKAVRVLGGATVSIGEHTSGWKGELAGMMHGAPLSGRSSGKKRRRPKSGSAPKRKKSRKHRTPAQKRATAKLIAHNKRARRGGGKRKKGTKKRRAKR